MNSTDEKSDLLTSMLRNRTLRNLIAIAIFLASINFFYSEAKAAVKGFKDGWNAASCAARP